MALVVTIVILIILAGVSINVLTGQDGLIQRALQAKEQHLIAQYKEQIDLIKTEVRLEYGNETTLSKLKEAFDRDSQSNWVYSTEIITDDETDKIKLTTNDGYIFYITEDTTEYKGTGDVVIPDIITAEMIEFTPSDPTWTGVSNVKEAITYLYSN